MAVAFAAVLVASVAGCRPKAGTRCNDTGHALCDGAGVLACQGGRYVAVRCRGPSGCTKLGNKVACDDSIAEDGDACLASEGESHACSADRKRHLVCKDGAFHTVEVCRGANGCTMRGEAAVCDAHVAEPGDACARAGAFACRADKKARLVCQDGRFQRDHFCRGPAGCREFDAACDQAISEPGDPCSVQGMAACSADGHAELVCVNGSYAPQRACKKRGCHVTPAHAIDCL